MRYVLNSIISAFDMSKLESNDKQSIISRIDSETNSEEKEDDIPSEDDEELNELSTEEVIDTDGIENNDYAIDEENVINEFLKEVTRHDKGLASKLRPFAKRRAYRKKLQELNKEIKEYKQDKINNFNSLEEEDIEK